ncbi:MAG: EAL domain-containing protein [Methylococcales bacterium]|nr:EAL domain-containing protein [Methylococcales bacterium]
MIKKRFFLSLTWRFSVIIGSIVLFGISIISYQLYLNESENFESRQQKVTLQHINAAESLIEQSFKASAQTLKIFLEGHAPTSLHETTALIDQNINHLSSFDGFEEFILFDLDGAVVKHWDSHLLPTQNKTLLNVLKYKTPDYQVHCQKSCYQQTIVPISIKGDVIGALSVARSFTTIMQQYKALTGVESAILIGNAVLGDFSLSHNVTDKIHIPFQESLFRQVKKHYSLVKLLDKRRIIKLDNQSYQLRSFPLKETLRSQPLFFVVISNISKDLIALRFNHERILWFSVFNFVMLMVLLLFVIHTFSKRMTQMSEALPLLGKQKYTSFKQKISAQSEILLAHDELDELNQSAFTVTEQLEALETQVQAHTQELLEQSDELASERDFSEQLVEVAPIIIILQNENGDIISINATGLKALELKKEAVIGKKFSSFIPKIEVEHLNKIEALKKGHLQDIVKIDGLLLTDESNCHISWSHSLIKGKHHKSGKLLLTLGINISNRLRIEAEMLKMSTVDVLTGLRNRKIFQSDLEHKIDLAKRYNYPLALFYLDLDQFKVINDSCNHSEGDKLLVQVAKQLKKSLRTTDMLFRIGGDEFTIIMQCNDLNGLEMAAAKINCELAQLEYHSKGAIYKVSVSIGVAVYPQHGKTVDDLLANADLAMYRAKEQGGCQHHVFSNSINYHTLLTQDHYWKEAIEEALLYHQFELFYQPILEIKTNTITHYECLIRMKGEQGQLIMPDEFIGVAEKVGIIDKIDRWVIKAAIQQHIKLRERGEDYKISINLSGLSFNDTSIFETISEQLNHDNVDPQRIIFEITETSAVSNFLAAQCLIDKIKKLGCAFALDDFGVGFSSFYYLKHLSADYVKIDGAFIRQIDKNSEDRIFTKALTEVSQALGKKVIAEFVENEAILAILKDFGIEYAQGYLIGKPMRLD